MLSMIKDGKTKLPVERVFSLARALECDAGDLLRLALEQNLSPEIINEIFPVGAAMLTTNERAILDRIRAVHPNDPKLTVEAAVRIDKLFETTISQLAEPVSRKTLDTRAFVLSGQVRRARHDIRIATQLFSAVFSRIQRATTPCRE